LYPNLSARFRNARNAEPGIVLLFDPRAQALYLYSPFRQQAISEAFFIREASPGIVDPA